MDNDMARRVKGWNLAIVASLAGVGLGLLICWLFALVFLKK
jgi:hypothetical protein